MFFYRKKMVYEAIPENFPVVCDAVEDFCKKIGMNEKNIVRYRFAVEECLLQWKANSEVKEFILRLVHTGIKGYIAIEAEGKSFNPLQDKSVLEVDFLNRIGLSPIFSYCKGYNRLRFPLEKKQHSQMAVISLAILTGVCIGTLMQGLLPEAWSSSILEGAILPVYDMFFRMMRCLSGPLIFLSVVIGIYGIGDVRILRTIGGKLLLSFLLVSFLVAGLGCCFFPLLHSGEAAANGNEQQLSVLFNMLLDMVPDNIIAPLSNGNTLQLIFLGIAIGLALLFLEEEVKLIAEVIGQINYLVSFLMGAINALVPYVITLALIKLILSGNIGIISSFWNLGAVFLLGLLVVGMTFTVYTALRQQVNPFLIFKKSLPAVLIALTTASSAASFKNLISVSEKRYGISHSLTSFGIPLGIVMCKTGNILYYLFITFYFGEVYTCGGSVSWVVMAAIISVLLAMATPPVPGALIIAYTVLFAQLGIPDDAIAILLSVDLLFDFVFTAVNVYNLPLVLIHVASSVGLLDEEVLRNKSIL